jgi:hypothetical protein
LYQQELKFIICSARVGGGFICTALLAAALSFVGKIFNRYFLGQRNP